MYFMLPASLQVWEAIPPLAYLQFPTRLLGPAAVMLGVLAGAGVSWTKSLPWRYSPMLFGALAVAGCGAFAMPLMYPPPWPDFGSVSAQRILATELNGRGIGTTSANDFLPIGVISVPGPQDSLIQSYATDTVDKVNRATLPGGTTVTPLDQGPEHNHYRVAGLTEFVLRLYTFYFPGWTAYVDGAKTPITVSEPEGWITFWVPAGEHGVWLRLENTPPRWVGWVFTTLGAVGLAALAVWGLRLRVAPLPVEAWGWKEALAMGAVLVGLMVVRGWADQAGWWRVHSTGNEVLVAQHQHFAALEQGVALLAYDLPVAAARPGDKVPLKLYWKAQAPVRVNLRVFVHFMGLDRQLWGQSDKWNPADFPTSRFPLDLYVRDEHEVALRPDAPPGEYHVVVGLWDADTGARMHVLDPNGAPTEADGILLPVSFTVRP